MWVTSRMRRLQYLVLPTGTLVHRWPLGSCHSVHERAVNMHELIIIHAHARTVRSAIATGRTDEDSATRHMMICRRRACCATCPSRNAGYL